MNYYRKFCSSYKRNHSSLANYDCPAYREGWWLKYCLPLVCSNRLTVRDAKTMLFHRPCESLYFVVFVILARFLIPEFGSYRVGRSVEIKISWWNKCKSGQEQSLDYQRCENNVLSLPLRTYLFFCTNICTKTAFFVQTRVFCKKRWFFCTNRYLYKFRMKKKTLDKYS